MPWRRVDLPELFAPARTLKDPRVASKLSNPLKLRIQTLRIRGGSSPVAGGGAARARLGSVPASSSATGIRSWPLLTSMSKMASSSPAPASSVTRQD